MRRRNGSCHGTGPSRLCPSEIFRSARIGPRQSKAVPVDFFQLSGFSASGHLFRLGPWNVPIPSPLASLRALSNLQPSTLAVDIALSCRRVGLGFVLATVVAVPLGILPATEMDLQCRFPLDRDAETYSPDCVDPARNARRTPRRHRSATRISTGTSSTCPAIAELWRRGSVVQSWLLDLTAEALRESPDLSAYEGRASDSGEGRGPSSRRSTSPYPCRCSRPRSSTASPPAAKAISPTRRCRPCVTASGTTWRSSPAPRKLCKG